MHPHLTGGEAWLAELGTSSTARGTRIGRKAQRLPDQMLLPGMEPGEETRLVACESPLAVEEAGGPDQHPAVQHSGVTCPNYGGVEFDDDGDCTRCWEPGVAKRASRSLRP